ncbi:MAG: SAM-dependent methyltransferase, partial [Bacteroidetes bacterium]
QLFELDKHNPGSLIKQFIVPLLENHDMGLLSEAGVPGVADPGSDIVQLAHQNNIKVIPLVGPSSLLLALMASGLNGQQFAFSGYLPIQSHQRKKAIQSLEKRSKIENQSQLFIETPYRNISLLNDILNTCQSGTLLCVAADITLDSEFIQTKRIKEWKAKLPDIHKKPAIFILLAR